jgi:NADH-quinone oxidoreductase subunit H
LYFGGYNFPFQHELGLEGNVLTAVQTAVFFGKILMFIFLFMWIRWTLPRFRFDQLMHLGWKSLIPISLINMLITGIVTAFNEGWF